MVQPTAAWQGMGHTSRGLAIVARRKSWQNYWALYLSERRNELETTTQDKTRTRLRQDRKEQKRRKEKKSWKRKENQKEEKRKKRKKIKQKKSQISGKKREYKER
jgi:hypothetical protein